MDEADGAMRSKMVEVVMHLEFRSFLPPMVGLELLFLHMTRLLLVVKTSYFYFLLCFIQINPFF